MLIVYFPTDYFLEQLSRVLHEQESATLIVNSLLNYLVVLRLMQVLFQGFLASCKHRFNALGEQVPYLDALVLRVFQLVLRDLLDDATLVLGHRFEDEGQTQLLVIILGRIGVRLPLKLVFKSFESVQLHAHEVKLIQKLVSKEHARPNVVY